MSTNTYTSPNWIIARGTLRDHPVWMVYRRSPRGNAYGPAQAIAERLKDAQAFVRTQEEFGSPDLGKGSEPIIIPRMCGEWNRRGIPESPELWPSPALATQNRPGNIPGLTLR